MNTFSKIAVVALAFSAFASTGCLKKGEGDPFLSLSSRKARLAGEWKVTKGEGGRTYTFASQNFTETMTYDGSQEVTVTTVGSGSSTNTDKYTQEMTFEKDGTFKIVNTDNNGSSAVVETMTGVWNFTAGVGEAKSKTMVVLYIESWTQGSNPAETYTGSNRPTMMFELYQLKGKEIIMIDKGTEASTNENREYKWTLEPK